jgi:hypothetical protein
VRIDAVGIVSLTKKKESKGNDGASGGGAWKGRGWVWVSVVLGGKERLEKIVRVPSGAPSDPDSSIADDITMKRVEGD